DPQLVLLDCRLPESAVQARYRDLWRYLEEGKRRQVHERYLTRRRTRGTPRKAGLRRRSSAHTWAAMPTAANRSASCGTNHEPPRITCIGYCTPKAASQRRWPGIRLCLRGCLLPFRGWPWNRLRAAAEFTAAGCTSWNRMR